MLKIILIFGLLILNKTTFSQLNGKCVTGNCINGSGSFLFTIPKDTRYTGTFENGILSGKGKLEMPNGRMYEGQFKNNNFNGEGIYYFTKEDKFIGVFKDGIPMNGEGSIFYDTDSIKIKGKMTNGKFMGKCFLVFKKGDTYEGLYMNDQFEGEGKYVSVDGTIYSGSFKNNKLNGKSIIIEKNGAKYEGEVLNYVYEGIGTFTYINGEIYTGNWKNGQREGQGIWKDKTGKTLYDGIWIKGDMKSPTVPTVAIDNQQDQKLKYIRNALSNRVFNGIMKVPITKQTSIAIDQKIEFLVITNDYRIVGNTSSEITIEGKSYKSQSRFTGTLNENVLNLKDDYFIFKDLLPHGLTWELGSLSLHIYTSTIKSGHFILDGKSNSTNLKVTYRD